MARIQPEWAPQSNARKLAATTAFVHDEATRSAVATVLAEVAPGSAVNAGSVQDAVQAIAHDPSPRTLIIDLSGLDEPLAALDKLAEVCLPGTRVIALGEVNDIHLYRVLRNSGVAEYLVKPVAADALRTALETPAPGKVEQPTKEKTAAARHDLIAVIGARGGVGATMAAVSLAWHFAQRDRQRTVLVDLDLGCGSAGLALDIEATHGLGDALANPDRIDALLIASATAKVSDNFYLLSSEQPLDGDISVQPDAVDHLVTGLRQGFQRLIFDAPRHLSAKMLAALGTTGLLVIVTDFSLAGVRDTGRLLRLAEKLAPSAQVLVVGNRVGVAKKGELSQAEIEKALSVKFAAIIPEDAGAVPHAINTGKPVLAAAANSPAANALRGLAAMIDGEDVVQKPRGLLGRLRGGNKAAKETS